MFCNAFIEFIDNNDGTVTEKSSGLIWQKEDDGQVRTAIEALSYCKDLRLGGYSDWRLPFKKELITLVDYKVTSGATINKVFATGTKASNYWSASGFVGNTDLVWFVAFDKGFAYYYNNSSKFYVRCVRGESSITPIFVDNKNGTITDRNSCFMWQKNESSAMTWEEAVNYCKALRLGGYSDWQLPDVHMLQSITDEKRFKPAIDAAFFPSAVSGHYWTVTEYAFDNKQAWDVGFGNGDAYFHDKEEKANVRCVRRREI